MDDATASDNCSESITVESETMGDAAGNYTIVARSLQRSLWQQHFCEPDDHGEDTTAPELSIPADYTPSALTS